MIDTILWCIGAAVSILMGMGVSAYLVYWTAKAGTLIYEYKRDYDLFQQWRHQRMEAMDDGETN